MPEEIIARTPGRLAEKGEFSNYDFTWACWDYLNEPIEASLAHPNPQQQALAVLTARVGKRRLRKLADAADLHPLPRALLEFRMQCEGMTAESR